VNRELYGEKFELPENIVIYLKQCYDAAEGSDDKTEGYRRNIDLRNKGFVTYQQLKRIKNFFDHFDGEENDLTFILNGGWYVKNWVDEKLRSLRDDIEMGKEIKSVVLPNQYIDQHEKNDIINLNRPSKQHKDTIGKYDLAVTESLKRINDLIKKII
jgi:hypothetical protein